MTNTQFGEECDIVAVLTPKPGKLDRVAELLTKLTACVKKNEPGVLSFHLYKDFDRETGQEELVLVEKYVNKEAYDLHAELPDFQAMHATFRSEELMAKPILIKSVKPLNKLPVLATFYNRSTFLLPYSNFNTEPPAKSIVATMNIRTTVEAFCADFANGTHPTTILDSRFTSNPEIYEYGPSWARSRLPYLGRSWTGRRSSPASSSEEDTTCDAYFDVLGQTLFFEPDNREPTSPPDQFLVSTSNGSDDAVMVKLTSTVGSNATGKKWVETFVFLFGKFDAQGRIGKLEIWSDSLSAWVNSE
ncbi:hypothetical protein M752DRAFT_311078 [Aspergillus phoenicis ATCC 13157]|uniref:ABM domain-containing protein n=1 Tax=Aspergillus phoenicis ATCC 13157 TaxID=1353007 RepID=A0A370P3U1_ASPPH|nr:hypothetical protein M752DRAFT_311078 [Aspergillus phoenicis ATCC 13157]